MHNTRILLAAFFSVLTLAVSAQKHKTETIVLKDGTVIEGHVIADSSDYLILKIKKPQVIVLKKTQVVAANGLRQLQPDKHGYYLSLSSSVLAGHSSSGKSGYMSIRLSNAYQFRNGLSLGVGTGIEELDVLMIPVYADIGVHPFRTRVSPYIWVTSGYGFPCSERENRGYYYDYYKGIKGGLMFNAGSGITVYSWNHFAVSMGIGYRYQYIKSEMFNAWRSTTSELVTNFNRLEVQFGFIFR